MSIVARLRQHQPVEVTGTPLIFVKGRMGAAKTTVVQRLCETGETMIYATMSRLMLCHPACS